MASASVPLLLEFLSWTSVSSISYGTVFWNKLFPPQIVLCHAVSSQQQELSLRQVLTLDSHQPRGVGFCLDVMLAQLAWAWWLTQGCRRCPLSATASLRHSLCWLQLAFLLSDSPVKLPCHHLQELSNSSVRTNGDHQVWQKLSRLSERLDQPLAVGCLFFSCFGLFLASCLVMHVISIRVVGSQVH